jgi:hypothetical protein
MSNERRTLELIERHGRLRYRIEDRVINGGEPIDLCFSGGWVTGRFEWSGDAHERPNFHYSLELMGEGKVETGSLVIPEGAVVRWPRYLSDDAP